MGDEIPRHPFEVNIKIGGNNWPYVLNALSKLKEHLERHGPECSLLTGEDDGCYCITIAARNVTAEQYNREIVEYIEAHNPVYKCCEQNLIRNCSEICTRPARREYEGIQD